MRMDGRYMRFNHGDGYVNAVVLKLFWSFPTLDKGEF